MSRRFQLSRGLPTRREEQGAALGPPRRGVCSICGCDTELLARILGHATASAGWFNQARHPGDRRFPGLYWVRRDELLRSLGFHAYGPLSKAGRCVPCHESEAAKLASEPAVRTLFDVAPPAEPPPVECRRPLEERASAPPRPSEYERKLAEIRARAAGTVVRERRFGKRGT
jgi:hypothetical protein